MRTLGILGGMSWESTAVYYRRLNQLIRDAKGGNTSAPILMQSYNFQEIEDLQHAKEWDRLAQILAASARALETAGAELMLIATNTMHVLAPQIEASVSVPLLHIADPTADALVKGGHQQVALLGTRFTMQGRFYSERLSERFGIDCLIPDESGCRLVHSIIYDQLCAGKVLDSSRDRLADLIGRLQQQGAEAVVLGCTELPLLVTAESSPLPVFDTMELHIQAAAAAILGESPA